MVLQSYVHKKGFYSLSYMFCPSKNTDLWILLSYEIHQLQTGKLHIVQSYVAICFRYYRFYSLSNLMGHFFEHLFMASTCCITFCIDNFSIFSLNNFYNFAGKL